MPDGIGKITARMRRRFPRGASIWDHYHRTIVAILSVALLSALGFFAYEAVNAGNRADEAAREVRVIKQSANCSPDANGNPIRPKKCAESISTGFRTLSPLQACELLQKGSKVIYIGGQRIPPVTCEATPEEREEAKGEAPKDRAGEPGTPATQPGSGSAPTAGTPQDDTSSPDPNPASGGGQGGNGAPSTPPKSPSPPSPPASDGGGEDAGSTETRVETTQETTVIERLPENPPAAAPDVPPVAEEKSKSAVEVEAPVLPLELCLLKPVAAVNCG